MECGTDSGGGVKCLQVNLNHCSDANSALNDYVINNSIDLILAQDPYITNDSVAGIPKHWRTFTSFNKSAIILITNQDYIAVESLRLENSVFIALTVQGKTVIIGSQYTRPYPNGDLETDFNGWSSYYDSCDDLLLCGDFNTPLLELGYARESERTDVLVERLVYKDLFILNDPDSVETFRLGSIIGKPDLTLGGSNIVQNLVSWIVDSEAFSFSDHKYIVFELSFAPNLKIIKRYKTKNRSFKNFNLLISQRKDQWLRELINITDTEALDEWIRNFELSLTYIMNKCFKLSKLSYRPNIVWFTNDLKIERNKVNALYKRSVRNSENETYREKYREARNQYKKHVKLAKKNSWLDYCQKTDEVYGNLFKYISGKTLTHEDLIFTVLNDLEPMASYDDVARQLMRDHFVTDEVQPQSTNFHSVLNFSNDHNFVRISNRELKYALSKQANNKAPGPDNIDAIVIKNLYNHCPELIKAILNKCLSLGHFPKSWKKGMVIYFRKKNKDPKTSKAYRPITLLNIIAKVLERIIKFRVMTKLESTGYLHDNQHGFREGRSTITAVNLLKSMVKQGLQTNKYCALVSIDIQGAFDNVSWAVLCEIIDSLPIPRYLKSLLKSYITDRQIGFSFSDGIRWYDLFKGCPQGSCIGPLLWLLVADVILKSTSAFYGNIISYADDFILIFTANTRLALETKVNSVLLRYTSIVNHMHLNISPEKSQAMLFGRFTLPNRHPIFKIENISVPVVDSVTYLGFILDARFSWISHIEYKRESIKSFIVNVNKTHLRDRGLAASYRKIWYMTVIEKRITYGHEVWYKDLKSHALRKLQSSQRLGLMSIIKPYRSISSDALCVLTGVPPIVITLANKLKEYDTIKGNNTIDIKNISIGKNNLMHNLPTFHCPFYNQINNLNFIEKVSSEVKATSCPIIYTDGSRMEEGTAAGFTVFYSGKFIVDHAIKLHLHNSIYQAELYAIYSAIKWSVHSKFNYIVIYTDSLSSVYALQKSFPANSLLLDIITLIYNNSHITFNIGWIKAHIGLIGNERADCIAKSVITDNKYDEEASIPYPLSIVKNYFNKKITQDWQNYWSSSSMGRDTYNIIKKVNTEFICSNRISLYFASGHGSFPSYLFKIKKRQDNLCLCGGEGTVLHYIFGRCKYMKHYFSFDNRLTIGQNLYSVIFDQKNYDKLKDNYNILNKNYSFIKYIF